MSPFNLWTVRVMRYVTIFMALISLVWWALLLISAFATPPGLHTRGSGFFGLGNATIALCLLIFNLIFFGTPSKSTRRLCAAMAVRGRPLLSLVFSLLSQKPTSANRLC